ncbi:MAG: hypothetical protein WBO10_01020 [Pyrinomonadaceae bacterium]
MLDFVPFYADKIPVVSYFWRREGLKYRERNGCDIDLTTAYWTPPLTPNMVHKSECDQIEKRGVEAIVSITDHDSIEGSLTAGRDLKSKVPISLEWTVPFGIGFFHVGVHNLPQASAREITDVLLEYTFAAEDAPDGRLMDILSMLDDTAGVLVILNHPLWDIELVGKDRHNELLAEFLDLYGHKFHALEINGFRSWSENNAVIAMAEAYKMQIVSGGDRHGCQPNTMINLTGATTFDEFADDIRSGKPSEVVIFPEYRQPLISRQLASFSEIMGRYPQFPESRERWFDRIYYDKADGGGALPLSVLGWRKGPAWARQVIKLFGMLGSPLARPIFRLVEKRVDRVPSELNRDPKTTHLDEKTEPKFSSI